MAATTLWTAAKATTNGGDGNDTLNGGDGNDTILVNFADSDTIDGGIGHDVVNVSGGSGDEAASVVYSGGLITSLGGLATNVEEVNLDLGGGTDTLDYTGSTAGVTVNLDTGTASGFTTIANIENVTGGSAADTLTGNGAANVLHGGGNGDTINGGGGADQLFGDGGADIISGGTGTDTIDGGAGNDTIDGGGDTDTAAGYDASYHLAIQGNKWVITNGTDTDTLSNVEKVTIGSTTYILVDSFSDGGFGSVQDAIDFGFRWRDHPDRAGILHGERQLQPDDRRERRAVRESDRPVDQQGRHHAAGRDVDRRADHRCRRDGCHDRFRRAVELGHEFLRDRQRRHHQGPHSQRHR